MARDFGVCAVRGADRRLEHQDQAPIGVAEVLQVICAKGRGLPCVVEGVSRCAPVVRATHLFYAPVIGGSRGQALCTRDALCPEVKPGLRP